MQQGVGRERVPDGITREFLIGRNEPPMRAILRPNFQIRQYLGVWRLAPTAVVTLSAIFKACITFFRHSIPSLPDTTTIPNAIRSCSLCPSCSRTCCTSCRRRPAQGVPRRQRREQREHCHQLVFLPDVLTKYISRLHRSSTITLLDARSLLS